MTIKKYARKPQTPIDAVQFTGDNVSEIEGFAGEAIRAIQTDNIVVETAHGPSNLRTGAWLAKGELDFYPIEDGEFQRLYDEV